jgi:Tol biopolymer transport system component
MSAKNTLWMCVALAAAIVAAFLVVVLATPTKPAEAAFPGRNGKIAFVRKACEGPRSCHGAPEIFTMKANGDNKTQLTSGGGPAFSPTGRKIAFPGIFTMSANGTDIKRVTKSEITGFDPAWSPDGTKIVFSGKTRVPDVHNYAIYVMKATPQSEANSPKQLTGNVTNNSDPDWQPLR